MESLLARGTDVPDDHPQLRSTENQMATNKPKATSGQQDASKPTRRQRLYQKMREVFPQITKEMQWNRRRHDGFATLPKTMALAMKIIDDNSEKGQPAGHTLLCLWLRSMDHPYLTIERERTFAKETGLSSERPEGIWRRRMATLVRLGFILAKEGTGGAYHHVALLNPNLAVARLHDQGLVQEPTWEFFRDRADEIGASSQLHAAINLIEQEKAEKANATKKAKLAKPKTTAATKAASASKPKAKAASKPKSKAK
jgi:hypothetical protein